jgi:high-affinity Fe2+/Pb2+ permease
VEPPLPRPPAIQIGLGTLLGITAAVAILFGVLRWLEVPAQASLLVLVMLTAGAIAAVGLVVAIARWLAAEAQRAGQQPTPGSPRDGDEGPGRVGP